MVNVLCLKWGHRYSPEFVNRLYQGVKRHLKRSFRFVCVTDDPTGLAQGIDVEPFPSAPEGFPANRSWPDIYVKLLVFKDGFANLKGPTLFLDIDQIIQGDLDCFFDYKPGEFCIIHNWIEWRKRLFRRAPKIGNSSCFRFEAGKSDAIYQKFVSEMDYATDRRFYSTEQAYMTATVRSLMPVNWWPKNWVVSFKRACTWMWPLNHFLMPRRNQTASILCFHGCPNPNQAIEGYKGKHLNTWVLPTAWVKDLWENG